MIRRETSPDFLNAIANQASVRAWTDYRGEEAPMDFTPACGRSTETGMVVLSNGEDAFACFVMTGDQDFQSHTFFGETCRGRKAVETGREMVEWMLSHGAKRLWGATPVNNAKARWFNRQIGAKVIGHDEYEVEGPVEIFEIVRH